MTIAIPELDRAWQLLSQERFGEALQQSSAVLARFPGNVSALACHAMANWKSEGDIAVSIEEMQRYQKTREHYRRFVEERGIYMGGPNGWQQFLQESWRSPEGRAAFQAYREQKRLAQAAPEKLHLLERLLNRHRGVLAHREWRRRQE